MARINDFNDFKNITSSITSFSHAYLFNVNSLKLSLPYVKEFAKNILFGFNGVIDDDTDYQIENDIYDDLYIVNPDTIGINTDEINKLLNYMKTKSIRENGKRVYIIYGFERLTQDVSNKILKFLEEPEENIYALLITENYEKILPTIISRCQVINLVFPVSEINSSLLDTMKKFFNDLLQKKREMIAYEYQYFNDALQDRVLFYDSFELLEMILSSVINKKCDYKYDDGFICDSLLNYSTDKIINVLNITNRLKCLVKNNINLNLLLDRYIIEITEELGLCKK